MSDEIFLVESGLTRDYFWDTKGNEVTECFGVSGDLFASMFCYFKGEPAFLQYEAVTQMVLYSIRKDDLEELCRQNLAISNLFRTICIEELYCLERKCKIFGKDDALSQYIIMLVRNVNVDSVISVRTSYVVNELKSQNLWVLSEPPDVSLVSCQSCAVYS